MQTNESPLNSKPYANPDLVAEGWYVAARSREVAAAKAIRVAMLGTEFLVMRTAAGKPVVMHNRCAHMGAPLSHGWVKNDCIKCPFHGFTYDTQGNCVHMPTDQDQAARFRLPAYITEERWGEIWFYFGEAPSYSLDVFSMVDHWVHLHFPRRKFRPHHHVMIPNALDTTHFRAVHGMTVDDYQLYERPDHLYAEMKFTVEREAPTLFRLLGYRQLQIHFRTYGGNNYLVEMKHPVQFSFLTSYCQHNDGGTWTATVACFPKFNFWQKWTGIGWLNSLLKMRVIADFFADDERWINFIKFSPKFISSDQHYVAFRELCNQQKVAKRFAQEPRVRSGAHN